MPGDGIGPEIADACRPVLTRAFPRWRMSTARIGWSCWRSEGAPVPGETWSALEGADAALMGAMTSKPVREAEAELPARLRGRVAPYRSPVLQLRERLDLYANVRPIEDVMASVRGEEPRFRFTVVRENTEGLYSHDLAMDGTGGVWDIIENDSTVSRSEAADTAVALRVTTGFAWRRLLRRSAALAGRSADPELRKVTVADKPNILRASGEVVRRAVEEVAPEFPDVEFEIANVDAVAMRMVAHPEAFDVIAAENLFGDVLSDLGAGLMGGLGLPAAANMGDDFAVFEPVHGSAPDIAGRGIANPAAYLLSAAMCAEHLGDGEGAGRLRRAVHRALATTTTPDLGGDASTAEFAHAVAEAL